MKIKLIVASMSVLGLIACPVITSAQTNSTKHHKHHKKMNQAAKQNDMAMLSATPAEPAPVATSTPFHNKSKLLVPLGSFKGFI